MMKKIQVNINHPHITLNKNTFSQNSQTKNIITPVINATKQFVENFNLQNNETYNLEANDPVKPLIDTNYKELSVSNEYIDIHSMSAEEKLKFFEQKQTELNSELSACTTAREKVVVAAEFLATKFPKLPYFWGGGHFESTEESKGINKKIGSMEKCQAPGNSNYPYGQEFYYAYDCSGFTIWCLLNSGAFTNIKPSDYNAAILSDLGEKRSIVGTTENIKPGDLAVITEENGNVSHVGIIIGVEEDQITIAHTSDSGGGMNITTQSTTTGEIIKDDIGSNKDINQNNKDIKPRVGEKYFTDIVLMNY